MACLLGLLFRYESILFWSDLSSSLFRKNIWFVGIALKSSTSWFLNLRKAHQGSPDEGPGDDGHRAPGDGRGQALNPAGAVCPGSPAAFLGQCHPLLPPDTQLCLQGHLQEYVPKGSRQEEGLLEVFCRKLDLWRSHRRQVVVLRLPAGFCPYPSGCRRRNVQHDQDALRKTVRSSPSSRPGLLPGLSFCLD